MPASAPIRRNTAPTLLAMMSAISDASSTRPPAPPGSAAAYEGLSATRVSRMVMGWLLMVLAKPSATQRIRKMALGRLLLPRARKCVSQLAHPAHGLQPLHQDEHDQRKGHNLPRQVQEQKNEGGLPGTDGVDLLPAGSVHVAVFMFRSVNAIGVVTASSANCGCCWGVAPCGAIGRCSVFLT